MYFCAFTDIKHCPLQVLKFRKSKDEDQREASFNKEVDPDVVHYQLQVETQPCGALYEATIMADFRNVSHYQYSVTPGISRINLYGSQPACIQDRFPRLRKFCCCQEFLEVQQKGVELGVGDKGIPPVGVKGNQGSVK